MNRSQNGSSGHSSPSPNTLDGIALIRNYLSRLLNECSGMKALLLDTSTTQIVSAVYSQTEILNQQVYLTQSIEKASSKSSSHLKAVCFVRPTAHTIDLLSQELQNPVYTEYHVFFSNQITKGLLRKLAEADTASRVVRVAEYFGDYIPVNPEVWSLQTRHTLSMSMAAGTAWAPQHATTYDRNLQGLLSMILSLKRRPATIRFAKSSPCAEELAQDLAEAIKGDDLFQFRSAQGLTILVLDRREDPVTPLLSQWTYQAMVHELLGLNNHRVVLKGAPNIAKDLEEVVLNDDFFRENRHNNFGELGENVQKLLQEYQQKSHSSENLQSIEDIQNFMDKFPELRSQSHTVSKHVAIMGELARLVERYSLMDVSQFEQSLACDDDHSAHWRELLEKLNSSTVQVADKLRVGLLYALRYEASANLHMVQQAMAKGGVPQDLVKLLPTMLRYGGQASRGPGLFGDHNLVSRMTKNIVGAVQGIDNVYSQHVPFLMDQLQQLVRGKLSPRDYPVVPGMRSSEPEVVLVFMVGGVTYEEGTKIAEYNATAKVPVVLAGSTIHNSTSFLDELKATTQS